MALICMVCHDTDANGRTELTKQTLLSLFKNQVLGKSRLIVVDNGSCEKTKLLLKSALFDNQIITLPENIGTARAINRALQLKQPGEHFVKIDNDVVIHSAGWVDEMEEAISRRPIIGILGLKRKDIIQSTWHADPNFRSELIMLPHEPGQRWVTFERTADVIGTCTMFNSALLDKVGYSYQPGLYGYEDVLLCHRSHLAGFENGFLNYINIDHIDPGGNEYIHWKQKHSGEHTDTMIQVFKDYVSGKRPIYEPFY